MVHGAAPDGLSRPPQLFSSIRRPRRRRGGSDRPLDLAADQPRQPAREHSPDAAARRPAVDQGRKSPDRGSRVTEAIGAKYDMKAILAPCALALLLGFPAEALNAAQTPPICRGKDLTQLASFASSRAKRADELLNADGIFWRIDKTLDGGLGWESHGAGYNAAWNNGVSNIITKQSSPHSQWLWTPNGISQSVAGIKMNQPLPFASGWSVIGTVEWGFNPFYGYPAAAQQAQVQNNGKALVQQNANADSSRTGQWDNSQGFIGISNKTYGTLEFGRVNALSLDAINAYDPFGGSYDFSPIGYSGSYAGFGDTELARVNTAFKYRLDYLNYHIGALAQVGGYDQGNGSNGQYGVQFGGDFNLFG